MKIKTPHNSHSVKEDRIEDGVFHPTSLEDYLRCKRKFYLRKVLGLSPSFKAVDLSFGSAIHAGVAVFHIVRGVVPQELHKYLELPDDIEIPESKPKAAEMLAIMAFAQVWSEAQCKGSQKKNLQTGLLAISHYAKTYGHSEEIFNPEFIETPIFVEMPNGTKLAGTMDRIWRSPSEFIKVVDTKTTGGALSDWYFSAFINSFQLGAYFHAAKEIFGRCDGCEIDSIRVPLHKTKPEDCYSKRTFPRTDLQQAEWLQTYINITSEIMGYMELDEEGRLRSFNQCPTACSDYGGCKYLPVCQHGFKHPAIKNEFTLEK